MRIGHGYDIHRLDTKEVAGQPLVIAGVSFDGSDAPDFKFGCVAHSDGDVIYHSVVRCSPARTGSNWLEPARTGWAGALAVVEPALAVVELLADRACKLLRPFFRLG